ncbi:MAG: PDZ domain-containing protein [bacterium]
MAALGGVALLAVPRAFADAPPEMDPDSIVRVTGAWRSRVFLVVADAGPCRAGVDKVLQDPSKLYRKRHVGCAVYVGARRLLTTACVVGRGEEVEVFTDKGEHMLARVVGKDPYLDVALLETVDDLPGVVGSPPPIDGEEPRAGVPCLVLGNANGGTLSASLGRMGGMIVIEPGGLPVRAHRVLAQIYPGDAGGPVLDEQGNFVGLLTGVSTPSRPPLKDEFGEIDLPGNRGEPAGEVGFAVPARECARAWEDLGKFGYVKRGFLGIEIGTNAEDQGGVRILDVLKGGPAQRSGIVPGDVITTFADRFVSSGRELCALVASEAPQRTVSVHVLRAGHERVLSVELGLARELPGRKRLQRLEPGAIEAPGSSALPGEVLPVDGQTTPQR